MQMICLVSRQSSKTFTNICDACTLHITKKLPIQFSEIFSAIKIKILLEKNSIFLLIFAHIIDCGYTLEPPRRDNSNEYQHSMFWIRNKKDRYSVKGPVIDQN